MPGSINKSISKQKLRLHSRYASTTYVSYLTNLLQVSKEDTLTEPQIDGGKKELNELQFLVNYNCVKRNYFLCELQMST